MAQSAPIQGILAVYKDEGITSHGVVARIRRLTGEQRVGHAGTLDPYARGVLVIAVGRAATRELKWVAGADKEYITRVKLGWRSTTEDREGTIFPCGGQESDFIDPLSALHTPPPAAGFQPPSVEQVRQALMRFEGVTDQRPPAFSAVKVGGRAAYKLARAKQRVDLPVRRVETKEIELLEYSWPCVVVRLVTGPGFYVRSFARDLGQALGTGGYMEDLERIRVGTYTKEQAVRLGDLARAIDEMAEGERAI
jgi:tRNA pseudouridine55 synthase